jgi:hypothetical protein
MQAGATHPETCYFTFWYLQMPATPENSASQTVVAVPESFISPMAYLKDGETEAREVGH